MISYLHFAGKSSFTAEGDFAERDLVVEFGSAAGNVSVCDALTDIPLGIALDTPPEGERVAVGIFGLYEGSLPGVAGSTIAAGDMLITNAAGRVIPLPSTAGRYYVIGRALSGANTGELVSIAHHAPRPAFTSVPFIAGATVTAAGQVTLDSDGKVIDLPSAPGTYYVVGQAVNSGSSGDTVEVLTQSPTETVVS